MPPEESITATLLKHAIQQVMLSDEYVEKIVAANEKSLEGLFLSFNQRLENIENQLENIKNTVADIKKKIDAIDVFYIGGIHHLGKSGGPFRADG